MKLFLLASLQLAASFTVGPVVRSAARSHGPAIVAQLGGKSDDLQPPGGMTLDTAKKAFAESFGPKVVSMPLQAFISEMLQSTTFATASKDYRYSPVMALGFVRLW